MSNSGVNFDDVSVIFYLLLEKEGIPKCGILPQSSHMAGALLTLWGTLYVESLFVGLCVKLSHEAVPRIGNFFFLFFKD